MVRKGNRKETKEDVSKCNINGKKQKEKKGLSPAMVVGQDKVVANGVVLLPHGWLAVVPVPHVDLSVPTIEGAMVYQEKGKERKERGRGKRGRGEERKGGKRLVLV